MAGVKPEKTSTAQLEDLGSHGYVVAAITLTYEAVALFPDGRHILLAPKRWPQATISSIPGLPPIRRSETDRLQWWAEDIRFVVNELTIENRIASPSELPFAGHLDLPRVGGFGHSAGGQVAAYACQMIRRLRACLNEDGLSGYAPYYPGRPWVGYGSGMLMARAPPTDRPTDEELAAMKMTRSQAEQLLERLKARQDAALRNRGKGSYRACSRER